MPDWDDDDDWFAEEEDNDENTNEEEGGGDDGDWMNTDSGSAQHYLCLIDCNRDMWKTGTNSSRSSINSAASPAAASSCAISMVLSFLEAFVKLNVQEQAKFHTGKRNGFAVLLYNTKYRTVKEPGRAMSFVGRQQNGGAALKEEEGEEEEEEEEDAFYARDRRTTVHELIPMTKPGCSTVQAIRHSLENLEALRNDYALSLEDEEEDDQDLPDYCPLQLALAEGMKRLERAKFIKTKSTPSAPKTDRIQVWIWTNQPKPKKADHLPALIGDLKEDSKVNLVLWGMLGPDGSLFDYAEFFDSLEAVRTPLRNKSAKEMNNLWDTILPELMHYLKPTRPLYRRMPLLFPDWKQTGMDRSNAYLLDWYRLVQESKEPNKLNVSQTTGRVVQSLTQLVTANGDVVYERITGYNKSKQKPAPRLRSYVPFGEDRVPMTEEDKKIIKRASNSNSEFPSLILWGFRPMASVPDLLVMETPYVCVPTELFKKNEKEDAEEIKNHANNYHAISSLCQAMRSEAVVAIGELLARTTSTSRLVALWPLCTDSPKVDPSQESDPGGGGGVVEWPDVALLATPLPFADEIRSVKPQAELEEPTIPDVDMMDALVDAATRLVHKQTLKDAEIGETFENAHLELYWDFVEKLAHKETIHGNNNNNNKGYGEHLRRFDTIVDEDEILQVVHDEIAALERLLPDEHQSRKKATTTVGKRKEPPPPDESGIDWMELFITGKVNDAKVPELKQKLKSLGEPVSGKKADLVARVTKHVQEQWEAQAKVKSEY